MTPDLELQAKRAALAALADTGDTETADNGDSGASDSAPSPSVQAAGPVAPTVGAVSPAFAGAGSLGYWPLSRSGGLGNDAELQAAMKADIASRVGSGIGRVVAQMNENLTGAKFDRDSYKTDPNENANQLFKRRQAQWEAEERAKKARMADPTSPEARRFQAAVAKTLPGIFDEAALATLTPDLKDQIFEQAKTLQGQRLKEKEDAQQRQEKLDERAYDTEKTNKLIKSHETDARIAATRPNFVALGGGAGVLNARTGEVKPTDIGGDGGAPMSPKQEQEQWNKLTDTLSTVRGKGSLTKENQDRLYSAERLEALVLGPGGQLQNLTPQQVREAGTSLANLISKGSMSQGQIEELTPHTLAGQFANLKQKILNEPQGADAQAFLQNMLDTAKREKMTALRQMREGQIQSLPNFMALRGRNKTRFDSLLKGAGIDPSTIDDNGLPVTAAKDAGDGQAVKVQDTKTGKVKTLPADRAAYFVKSDPSRFRIAE